MLQLTKRTEYGLIALVAMVGRQGHFVSAREISELGRELHGRVARLSGHFVRLGTGLDWSSEERFQRTRERIVPLMFRVSGFIQRQRGDGDGFPNRYFQANDVVDFNTVVAVRIMLLLHSFDDRVTDDPQTYTFNGVTVTPNDRRIRQVFTTTIALRNRVGS